MRDPDRLDPQVPVYLTANIRGVVLPTWLAVALGIGAVLATVTLLLTIILGVLVFQRAIEAHGDKIEAQTKEIRVMQLHVQDVESILIQQGLAHRDDLAEWHQTETSTRQPARDKEK